MVRWQFIIWSLSLVALDKVLSHDENSQEPLILTPLLEAGKCEEAQKSALVTPDFGGVTSYTGFFNVDKKCGNNVFFWFFKAEKKWESAPVLLWLNTYSRRSVMLEIFLDAGPFAYTREQGFTKRQYPWTRDNNVLFIDHPVGNGYSFSEKECLPKTLEKIYSDAYEAIVQFFQLFSNLSKNKFFIVGQNFAGKYAPGIAMQIHKANEKATTKINLVGIVIGDPYLDMRCHPTSEYEYQLGIIDKKNKIIAANYDKQINDAITAKDYDKAYELSDKRPYVENGLPSFQNILYDYVLEEDFQTLIRSYKVRPQLHVGNKPFHLVSEALKKSLKSTIYQPVNSCVEELLKTGKYIVGFYGGQLDVYNPYTSISCVLEGLSWPGVKDFKAAKRTAWFVDNRLAGWVRKCDNVWEVAVRDSGMYTTRDQPCATYILLKAALADKPGETLLDALIYGDPED